MHKLSHKLLPLALSLSIVSAAKGIVVNPGDLLVSFYQLNSTDTGVESNTYIFNLGPAQTWRETSASTTLIGNIGTDLTETFGAGWAENTRIRMAIVGVVGVSDPLTNGDPPRSIYYSRGISSYAPAQTDPWSMSSTQRGTAATQLKTYTEAMNGKPSSPNNANGAVVTTSTNNNVTVFLPPVQTTNFGIGITPATSLTEGTIASSTSYTIEAAVEVFRILHSTTASGVDLTVNKTAGNATIGAATYIGTFTLDSAGNVRYDVPPTVSQSPYQTWASANNLSGPNALASADPDNDGLQNGTEFLFGGNPAQPDRSGKEPSVSIADGRINFRYRRTDAAASLSPVIEHDSDLLGTWTPAVPGANGVTTSTETDFFDSTTDRVTVSIPISGLRNFTRLRVNIP